MTKILITGGCGFVGSNLIRQIVERGRGEQLAVLDNETMGSPRDLPSVDIEYHKGDICDLALVSRVAKGCDTIIHLAANTRVIESIEDPTLNFEVNVRGTFNVLMAARDAGVRSVVMASTGGAILGDVEPPVHEGMVPQPAAPYGASKLACEGYASAFAGSYGMQVTALRFSNVYGPRSYRKGSAVAQFFKQVLDGKPITVYGDGSQVRDLVYVIDLCKGILQAIDANVSGVFQLGTGKPTSINELLGEMKMVVGPQRWPAVNYEDWRAGEVRKTYCDITRAREAFGFAPATPLADGLQATWNWFLSETSGSAS
ncbi:NAD-dependent epimerase/dehydratase family protein [Reyranella sp.]|uniref:NAD-dependent epimerase/dehydratase family protein n=1 Tax=Reyranella sp. TaxID=1929291 RepID=UPI003C7C2E6C